MTDAVHQQVVEVEEEEEDLDALWGGESQQLECTRL